MSDRLTVVMRLENSAVTQYQNYPFDSVVQFNGKAVFFGPDGIFEEGGGSLNGTNIDAWMDLPLHDFQRREQKFLAGVDLGYESEGDMTVTLTPDEVTAQARDVTFSPTKSGQVVQDDMKTLRRRANDKGRYWGVRIANTDGQDFSVDYFALAPVFLKRRSIP